MYSHPASGGLGYGGFNFDAKVRRQSVDPADLLYGHIGGLDTCAQALSARGSSDRGRQVRCASNERYAGWAVRASDARRTRPSTASPPAPPPNKSTPSRSRDNRSSTKTCSTAISDRTQTRGDCLRLDQHRSCDARAKDLRVPARRRSAATMSWNSGRQGRQPGAGGAARRRRRRDGRRLRPEFLRGRRAGAAARRRHQSLGVAPRRQAHGRGLHRRRR